MIRQGMDAESIAEELEKRVEKCHASFILDTLEFLHAGGRCSTVAALGANVLKLKPCIEVSTEDGSMTVGKKYRGALEKVLVKYVKDKLAAYPDIKTDMIFITMHFDEIHVTKASCTISSHCGPNTLGILFESE